MRRGGRKTGSIRLKLKSQFIRCGITTGLFLGAGSIVWSKAPFPQSTPTLPSGIPAPANHESSPKESVLNCHDFDSISKIISSEMFLAKSQIEGPTRYRRETFGAVGRPWMALAGIAIETSKPQQIGLEKILMDGYSAYEDTSLAIRSLDADLKALLGTSKFNNFTVWVQTHWSLSRSNKTEMILRPEAEIRENRMAGITASTIEARRRWMRWSRAIAKCLISGDQKRTELLLAIMWDHGVSLGSCEHDLLEFEGLRGREAEQPVAEILTKARMEHQRTKRRISTLLRTEELQRLEALVGWSF